MSADSIFVLFVVSVVAALCIGAIVALGRNVYWNRLKLIALESQLGMPEYAPPLPRRRGLASVLADQWWAYVPLLGLAALTYWRNGPGFEMWVMLGAAAFWIATGAAEDTNS